MISVKTHFPLFVLWDAFPLPCPSVLPPLLPHIFTLVLIGLGDGTKELAVFIMPFTQTAWLFSSSYTMTTELYDSVY